MAINAWEMDIWIYPNYRYDENGILSFDEDNTYQTSIRAEDVDYVMEWLQREYSDMTFTALNISEN